MNGAGRLETFVAALLRYGTWLASTAIGLGLALASMGLRLRMRNPAILPNIQIAKLGIALFILLPMFRVSLMLFVFLRERDFRFASIAGLVIAIILLGIALGLPATSGMAG